MTNRLKKIDKSFIFSDDKEDGEYNENKDKKQMGVVFPKGFKANGYKEGKYGVTIVYSENPNTVCSGVFTSNKVYAHPVKYCKDLLLSSDDKKFNAIVINSGNANCFTKDGMQDNNKMVKVTSELLNVSKNRILSASTGVIGRKMPMDIIIDRVEKAYSNLKVESDNENASKAIMTTDAFNKSVCIEITSNDKVVKIGGIAKGAGMIAPNMQKPKNLLHATMLAVVTTDLEISANDIEDCLYDATEKSFNNTVVDGDTSTNDSLYLMANGESGVKYEECKELFDKALSLVCQELAKMMARDGEGAGKLVEVLVKGAKTQEDAKKASMAVVRSLLVKTAVFGNDPNWGRIVAAIGYSGADMDMDIFDLSIGDFNESTYLVKDGVQIADDGTPELKEAEQLIQKEKIKFVIDLKRGNFENTSFGCDLGHEYVRINAEYTT
ncbi:glutamate N-acetyltransferase/amino-acid N-acetyltransferase [Methanococcus voltae]|nr:glutamate N-acetyltransferase/amino-acid N-acetyltransferase [Methanococcus voltae]